MAAFETALGPMAIAWSEAGVTFVELPQPDSERVLSRLKRRSGATPAEPPPGVAAAIEGIQALFAGERRDLADAPLDLEGWAAFDRQVWDVARSIPPGATRAYGEIAKELGDPLLARDVGAALGRNPCPVIVPCHRVLAAGGKIGGFSAFGGIDTKRRLLAIEAAFAEGAEPDLFR